MDMSIQPNSYQMRIASTSRQCTLQHSYHPSSSVLALSLPCPLSLKGSVKVSNRNLFYRTVCYDIMVVSLLSTPLLRS
ncbi:hypothetical protein NEUTE1DRAFT_95146 [Neurospora tetrasperma FGSC 2508]|uniref:Uncharacterized protein n=1 Tax=Neurospora tetrasperma (strain FGSC 2508 / ATCC MYA-4615 / P0657) TaxID=510951 RepID=F8MNZ9_NEUT8|nr:uncharacterized protein NEUTE1DRAFT_95146 [Neurospora tetrasperma FGSC 2508]EGO56218.1 hypothetical protein NEUTE1DRAFT_95146 [Neurospora tetrasperma FGSC 2508]EGZ70926.1 hypothetical protein NEUTE2DRAFT_121887 [Neurospora tetrasperma FGSC 2509]